MPTVSIALATYDGERFLEAQLASLLSQTVLPSEVVVVDDASTDGTKAILREFARKAPFPVDILENSVRVGYRVSFLKAVGRCRSDLIAFCDQDDLWDPTKIARTIDPFSDPAVLMTFHNADIIDQNNVTLRPMFKRRRTAALYSPLNTPPWIIVPGFSQTFRRALVRWSECHAQSVDPFQPDQPMAHDQFFFFWASVLGSIAYVPASLVRYRQHSSNALGWYQTSWLEDTARDIVTVEQHTRGALAASANRAELLRAAEAQASAGDRVRLTTAAHYYDRLNAACAYRDALYASPRLRARVSAFAGLLAAGGYTTPSSWRWGLGALVMDFYLGVPFGPRLKALQPKVLQRTSG